jgi:lipopolysaccharide/colanic/teichoic acid biosynthesis glycosyltransferase
MGFLSMFKYFLRFALLQVIITFVTIWYFDKFLIGSYTDGYDIIIRNLLEDRFRFYDFIPYDFVKIDIYLALFVFIFLIILYSSNFYSYVNDLSLTVNKGLFDEYLPIYLIWTSTYLSFLQIFRFTAVSRGYLILFTFIVPIVLIIFRNTEAISRVLGRNPSRETFLSFNLDKDSIFREIRIVKFRKNLHNYKEIYTTKEIKHLIESHNKESEINLIVIVKNEKLQFDISFENYLLNLNKKILLISENEFKFSSIFLFRAQKIANNNIAYINNDIQYGSKYILKRSMDLAVALITFPILFIIFMTTCLFVFLVDGSPSVIKQKRVGLHGKEFNMYKLRTMKRFSHENRKDLQSFNKKSGPLFKIDDDPRFIKGAKVLRKFSLDEIPQFLNVIKGDMSVVGPRPLFPEDNVYFNQNYLRRLNVLPGITGLLQINERNTDNFETWFKYDLEYIENWSILLDIKIIFKTPFSIFRSKISGK